MKRCFILLEDGFEECEALISHDILLRSGQIIVDLVGNKEIVTTSMGVKIHTDKLLKDINLNDYDFMILPGGKVGVDNISSNELDISVIKEMIKRGKHVHAICAAPSILGELGYLDDKEFTCFPSFERGKGKWLDKGSVISKGVVTGRSMGHTIEFAENIIRVEIGEEYLQRVHEGSLGLK